MLAQPPLWLILVAFVCALGPLVFFHELGHYLVGRMFRVPAETFSIGFGRELFGWTDKQGTRWKVAWLPLGGYVKFVGDMYAASVPSDAEDIPPELRDRAFQFRPVWQRFLIVLAGPVANFILAILFFTACFTFVGVPQSNIVSAVQPGSAAASAGIQPGDRIVSIAGRSTPTFDDVRNVVALRANETVAISIDRGGRSQTIPVTLKSDSTPDEFGQRIPRGLLGVFQTPQALQPVSVVRAVPMAVDYTGRLVRTIVDGVAQIFRGRVSATELKGPVGIAQIAGQAATLGALPFVDLLALLSINLGFINLLPVPLLDGGHLFFYILEAIRRRPVSERVQEWAFRGGLGLILALLAFTTMNNLTSVGLWDRLERLID
jgi:regulator of sigma E protease